MLPILISLMEVKKIEVPLWLNAFQLHLYKYVLIGIFERFFVFGFGRFWQGSLDQFSVNWHFLLKLSIYFP